MTKEYRNIRIPEDVFAALEAEKREGETWEGLMWRLLDGNEERPDWSKGMWETIEEFREDIDELPEETANEIEARLK